MPKSNPKARSASDYALFERWAAGKASNREVADALWADRKLDHQLSTAVYQWAAVTLKEGLRTDRFRLFALKGKLQRLARRKRLQDAKDRLKSAETLDSGAAAVV